MFCLKDIATPNVSAPTLILIILSPARLVMLKTCLLRTLSLLSLSFSLSGDSTRNKISLLPLQWPVFSNSGCLLSC